MSGVELSTLGKAKDIATDLDPRVIESARRAGLHLITLFGEPTSNPWPVEDGSMWLATNPQIIKGEQHRLRVRVFARLNAEDFSKIDVLELRAEDETEGTVGTGKLLYSYDGTLSWGASGDPLSKGEEDQAGCIILTYFLAIQKSLMKNHVPHYRSVPHWMAMQDKR